MPRGEPEPIALPAHVWRDPVVLDLCRDHDANGLFQLARRYGVSNERLAYWVDITPAEISRRMHGRLGPVIALDRWLRIADGLNMPDHARLAAGLANRSAAEPKSLRPPVPTEPRSERAPTRGMLAMTADESAKFAEWTEAANAGRFSVDQLAAELRVLSLAYLTEAPVPLLLVTRSVRNKAIACLQDHSAPARARDLYSVAGYACTLLAWISGDLGRPEAADTHARAAWLCADLSDSAELRAWVRATQSKTAFWDRRLADAAALASAGRSITTSSSVAVLLAAQEADAAASMGRSADALRAVQDLTDVCQTVTAPDALGGLLSCDSARQSNYAAAVYARIGRASEALREAGSALADYRDNPQHAHGTEMQLRISQTLGHLAAGGLDGAADSLAPVLVQPEDKRLATVAARLTEVTTALDADRFTGSRQAESIREAIVDFNAVRPSLPVGHRGEPG